MYQLGCQREVAPLLLNPSSVHTFHCQAVLEPTFRDANLIYLNASLSIMTPVRSVVGLLFIHQDSKQTFSDPGNLTLGSSSITVSHGLTFFHLGFLVWFLYLSSTQGSLSLQGQGQVYEASVNTHCHRTSSVAQSKPVHNYQFPKAFVQNILSLFQQEVS